MENSFFDTESENNLRLEKEHSHGKISLCAIVKNEAQFIEEFLENVNNFVNEIIIVDTGSTDSTVEIAQNFGAKIINYTWNNDFSSARNESLKYATGDWILVMDADERLNFTEESLLTKLISLPKNENEIRVFSFKQIHYFNDQLVSAIQYKDSLFENNRELLFDKPIHEFLISPNQLKKINRLFVKEAEIHHYGHVAMNMNKKDKQKRNLEILEKAVMENPGDLHNLYYLASNYYEIEQYDNALAIISKAIEISLKEQNIDSRLLINFYRILSYIYLESGLYDKLLELSREVNQKLIEHPEILLNIGIAAYKKGDFKSAFKYFDQGILNNTEKNYPTFLIVNNYVNENINYYKGLLYKDENKFDSAMDLFLNSNLNNNESILEIEKLLFSDFSEKAILKLQNFLENNPDSTSIRTLLSNYYMKNENFTNAIEILQLNNYEKGLILDIAEHALNKNENKKVIGLCNYYQGKYGENVKLLKLRSQAFINQEKFNDACKDLVKAVDQARWDKELLKQLINLLTITSSDDLKQYTERLEKINNII